MHIGDDYSEDICSRPSPANLRKSPRDVCGVWSELLRNSLGRAALPSPDVKASADLGTTAGCDRPAVGTHAQQTPHTTTTRYIRLNQSRTSSRQDWSTHPPLFTCSPRYQIRMAGPCDGQRKFCASSNVIFLFSIKKHGTGAKGGISLCVLK